MAIILDETTLAAYQAQTVASTRAALIVSALSGTVTVEICDGNGVVRASGTMASPWATASGSTVTIGRASGAGIPVSSGGVPDGNWYCQFRSGSRFVRGTFGVQGSGQDFVWSLPTFSGGQRGTIGAVTLTASGVSDGSVLLYETNVTGAGRYLGSFRVPADPGLANPLNWSGSAGASPGAGGFWFNPAGNGGAGSLIVAGRNTNGAGYDGACLTEISIPAQANWATNGNPSTASGPHRGAFLVPSPYWFDLTGGTLASAFTALPGDGVRAGGVFIHNGNLYQNFSSWYAATEVVLATHFKRSGTAVNAGSVSGPYALADTVIDSSAWTWTPPGGGGASGANTTAGKPWHRGPNATIPAAWQAALGGKILQGQTQYSQGLPMGCGPAIFSMDPDQFGVTSPLPNNALVGYSPNHSLGTLTTGVTSPSGWVRGISALWGLAFPSGSGSVLAFTSAGLGSVSYGTPGVDIDPATGSPIVDPAHGDKGYHAWPYRLKVLAYRASDMAEAKAGTRNVFDVLPYSTWQIDLPGYSYDSGFTAYTTVAYDDASKRLFVMERETSRSYYDPIIHVYQLSF